MMSYSFTDPEDEEESSEINLVEGEVEKPEPRRFMLPVGDLLNHTWDNNARIEFGDDCLTINATKVPIFVKTNPKIPKFYLVQVDISLCFTLRNDYVIESDDVTLL